MAEGQTATTSPLGRSSTTKGSNRCAGVAEGQTQRAQPAQGRASSEPRNVAPAEGGRPLLQINIDRITGRVWT
ncbi:hypothetical protein SGRA_0969 [Saprospira grandis str. Lewin]|uniref:Uncharacterized protein n=1 Tax=Saprospira grandis (strain Lewin) TaxID=984262 RepID=H6L2X8_SAPGL|nr:hypothetical protein SGRA_0969 [Saprospira grandis str. Lewin]